MSPLFKLSFYLLLLFLALYCYLRYFRRLTLSLKMLTFYLGATLLSECVAAWLSYRYHNNMPAYHVYSPVSLALVALYYNYSLSAFRKYRVGYYVAAAGIVAAVLNTIYLQHLMELDSYMVLFSGLCTIAMALYAMLHILGRNDKPVKRNIHFWISFIFLIYWICTYLIWALLQVFVITDYPEALSAVFLGLWGINCITYAAFGMLPLLFINEKRWHD